MAKQFEQQGLCQAKPKVVLCLAAGMVRTDVDEEIIRSHFKEKGWLFMGPSWIRGQLESLAQSGYENSIAVVVAKVLLRDPTSNPSLDRID